MSASINYEVRVRNLLKKSKIDSPPVPVENVANTLGLKIQRSPLPDNLSGLLVRTKNFKRPVIGVNSTHATVRQRFTIAHEIAHFILHEGEEIHVDRNIFIKFRNSASSTAEKPEEIVANGFAAELLMPKSFLEADLNEQNLDLGDEDLLDDLAERYKVSRQAMAFRLSKLGFLSVNF